MPAEVERALVVVAHLSRWTPTVPATISFAGALNTPRVIAVFAMIPQTWPDGGTKIVAARAVGGDAQPRVVQGGVAARPSRRRRRWLSIPSVVPTVNSGRPGPRVQHRESVSEQLAVRDHRLLDGGDPIDIRRRARRWDRRARERHRVGDRDEVDGVHLPQGIYGIDVVLGGHGAQVLRRTPLELGTGRPRVVDDARRQECHRRRLDGLELDQTARGVDRAEVVPRVRRVHAHVRVGRGGCALPDPDIELLGLHGRPVRLVEAERRSQPQPERDAIGRPSRGRSDRPARPAPPGPPASRTRSPA